MIDTAKAIRREIESGLPGLAAQQKMAPSVRYKGKTFPESDSEIKNSGVLILLYPKYDKLHLVFMKRTEYPGAHSGQVSFPGGKYEDGDKTLIDTAKREANEELAIKPSEINIIGQLSPLFVPISGFKIQPVVAYQNSTPDFVPDPEEVQEVIEISAKQLFKVDNCKTEILEKDGYKVTAPYFDAKGHHIWGATAMILSELRDILRRTELI